jgi:CBS domain containing-hemolysin-like protein
VTEYIQLLAPWIILTAWNLYVGLYRTHVDRVRAGLSPSPNEENRFSKLIGSLLTTPNQDRPFHVEAALLSCLQVIFGFLLFIKGASEMGQQTSSFGEEGTAGYVVSIFAFTLAFLWERLWANLIPRRIASGKHLDFHLKAGFPLMLLVRFLCMPFSYVVNLLQQSILSIAPQTDENNNEGNEVAEHIRTLGMESSNMDPEVFEIVGNTLEMSQLNVQDAMVPRNQVQVLDDHDTLEKNMEIARTCGHTRLPLCIGNLDHCLGIIHVKYAFRLLSEGTPIDLRSLAKAPAMLSKSDTLPVALRKMMKWKVHMALVRDEFGGIDGVITLEDMLEEVVGEIQDEFDADEHSVEKIGEGRWRVAGLTPVHELPDELKLDENGNEDELTSFGGFVTRELGRIPEKGETVGLQHLKVTILEADDTRVLSAEATLADEIPSAQEE